MLSVWCHIHSEVLVWFNIACFGYQVRLVSAHQNESNKKTILHSLVLERIKYTIIKNTTDAFGKIKKKLFSQCPVGTMLTTNINLLPASCIFVHACAMRICQHSSNSGEHSSQDGTDI